MSWQQEPEFLTREIVDAIHEDQIDKFWGLHGFRDENALESAIAAAQNVYHYGGAAHVAYPADPSTLTDPEWAHYLFYRANPKGLFAERWSHSAGCRRWFNLVRDTVSNRILAVYRPGDSRPKVG